MLHTVVIALLVFVLLYLAGRYIKPVGGLFSFTFVLVGKPFARLEQFVDRLRLKIPEDTTHPGLQTTVLFITLLLALAAIASEAYNTIQALPALFPDANFTLPLLPSWVNFAMGALFLSLNALFGSLWLEGKQAIPKEARIFNVPETYRRKFERFIFISFLLSLLASVAFYGLKVTFLVNPDGNTTHTLQLVVFVLLGVLAPLVGVVSLYILALGLLALLRIPVTLVWFVASLCTDLFEYLSLVFSGSDIKTGVRDQVVGTVVYLRDTSITLTHALEQKDVKELPIAQHPQALLSTVRQEEQYTSTSHAVETPQEQEPQIVEAAAPSGKKKVK